MQHSEIYRSTCIFQSIMLYSFPTAMTIIQTLIGIWFSPWSKGGDNMYLIEHKKGYLCGVANREGETYADWRTPYIDRSGLLMIYESNSHPGKHAFVFFTAPASGFPGHYLKTSPGDLETEDGNIIKLTTGNSIYRFRQDDSCIPSEDMKLLLADMYEEFGPSNSIRQVMEKELSLNAGHEPES